jgi:hypothetical protein
MSSGSVCLEILGLVRFIVTLANGRFHHGKVGGVTAIPSIVSSGVLHHPPNDST